MDQCGPSVGSPHHELTPSNNLPLTTESLDTSSAGPNAAANEDMTSTCKAVTRANKADKWGEESFQKEIDKWEEFYDDMKAYLTDDTVPTKSQSNIVKHSTSFSLGPDNTLYHRKLLRDSPAILQLPVVRSYEERMQVCRTIHLSTGEEGIHHRRDTMLELLGQQYYWKGQRRDVCQCIASCDMCSLGLGAKRRAKPPGQRRDIRPLKKLLKVAPSVSTALQPPLSSSTITVQEKANSTSAPLETSTQLQVHSNAWNSHTPATTTSMNHNTHSLLTDSSLCVAPNSAFLPVDPLSNLYTIADACVSVDQASDGSCAVPAAPASKANTDMNIASEVVVSENSGLQIFTTINEPYYENHDRTTRRSTSDCLLLLCGGDAGVAAGVSGDEEQYVVQESSMAEEESGSSSFASERDVDNSAPSSSSVVSIYQLLFQLPSVPNTALCTAVIESMQLSLKRTADPAQLAQVSSQSLLSVFNLSPSTVVALVCPSHAAAYVSSLAAVLIKQGHLTITPHVTQRGSAPAVVLHDAACGDAGSPRLLSSLVGGCNWNVGTHTQAMDRDTLQAAVASNRVSAVFHRPYAYPRNASFLSLDALSSLCRSKNIAVITDCSGMPGNSLVQLTSTVKEMLMTGADLIMLPNTANFQGPPHTCVVIGKVDLLGNYWEQLSLLQTQLPLPLVCLAYDTVGTVVAFKSLQVAEQLNSS